MAAVQIPAPRGVVSLLPRKFFSDVTLATRSILSRSPRLTDGAKDAKLPSTTPTTLRLSGMRTQVGYFSRGG